MSIRTSLLAAVSFLALAGCGASDADTKMQRFVEGCIASSNLERPFCECAARQAREDLSENGFAFLSALLNDDELQVADLRKELSPSEAMAAGMFMVNAHRDCAQALQ